MYSKDTFMIRRTEEWDGIDRRRYDRNRFDDYDRPDTTIIERVESEQKPYQQKVQWISIIPIVLTIVGTGGTFIFNLYDKVAELNYKQATVFEKLTENKKEFEELKLLLKESEKSKEKIVDQISSMEQTIMEIYRRK